MITRFSSVKNFCPKIKGILSSLVLKKRICVTSSISLQKDLKDHMKQKTIVVI